jgi:DNA-directed RNA polymerase subunit M/transcription elongation factor TFIIS
MAISITRNIFDNSGLPEGAPRTIVCICSSCGHQQTFDDIQLDVKFQMENCPKCGSDSVNAIVQSRTELTGDSDGIA